MITLLKQNVTPYPFIRTIMWDYFLKRLSYTLFMRRHFEMKIVLMRIVPFVVAFFYINCIFSRKSCHETIVITLRRFHKTIIIQAVDT